MLLFDVVDDWNTKHNAALSCFHFRCYNLTPGIYLLNVRRLDQLANLLNLAVFFCFFPLVTAMVLPRNRGNEMCRVGVSL